MYRKNCKIFKIVKFSKKKFGENCEIFTIFWLIKLEKIVQFSDEFLSLDPVLLVVIAFIDNDTAFEFVFAIHFQFIWKTNLRKEFNFEKKNISSKLKKPTTKQNVSD